MKKRISELEKAYLEESDWLVRENANVNKAYSSFIGYLMDKILKDPVILREYLPENFVKMHISGDIHIHKLPHSLFIPYCVGWSYYKLLKMGLRTPTINTRPAKHLDTAISHLVSFFFLASQEWSGAQAVSAIDLFLAPFIRYDKLGFNSIKQALQRFVYELNYPSRLGFQSPFTNVTIVLDTVPSFLNAEAIIGGRKVGILGDYLEEAIEISKALFMQFLEGDADGKPFTFPIVTMMFTKRFDWNGSRWGDLTDLLFEVLARRGTIYILNGYQTDVSALYAMCCRLTIDFEKLSRKGSLFKLRRSSEESLVEELEKFRRVRGLWALPDATGSIGVITINLPRLAFFNEEEIFFDKLRELLKEIRNLLIILRKRYEISLEKGLMPITKLYLGHLNNHFSTIGVIGLPEAVANLMNNEKLWIDSSKNERKEATILMKRIIQEIRKICQEYEAEDGYLYNVEEVPGESAAYRLALSDLKLIKREKMRAFIPMLDDVPFYSNSIVPYYADIPLSERISLESEVQKEFTGGVMMHIFLAEMPDERALKRMIYNIVTKTKIVYFSITPALTFCNKCGWEGVGVYESCPKCGSENIEIWSRIVGYYRPIKNWNIGRRHEFRSRIHYSFSTSATIKQAKITSKSYL
ncbi:MAG: anaerobic ribonucleoside triphosphate reductase [Candidatus Njordarchaeales archaeon]